MDRSRGPSVAVVQGRVSDAVPELRASVESSARTACHVELVEDIPTGHARSVTLEVSTTIDPPDDPAPDQVPGLAPLAFGAPLARSEVAEPGRGEPFGDATEHLTALLELTRARAALAVAERWHDDPRRAGIDHVLAREVSAIAGAAPSAGQLASARVRIAARTEAITARTVASLGAGLELPLVELGRELGLSDLAVELLVAALAPHARSEIGRLYGVLASEAGGVIDDALLASLLARDDAGLRDRMCRELAEGSALVRHGLVVRDAQGGLEVDEAVLARLRGMPAPRSACCVLRAADRSLDELVVDRPTLRALVLELASPRDPDHPVRVVIRGRRGSGRHATIAALAARVDRRIACIDAAQLPRGPGRAAALRRELNRAVIARAIPVISGLEIRGGADPDATMWIAQVLHGHPGPLVVRAAEHAALPLAPDHIDIVLAPLADGERHHVFALELERHAIAGDAEQLAARHAIGPGRFARAVAEARRWLDRSPDEPTTVVDAIIRRHEAARIAHVATRVIQPTTWERVGRSAALGDRVRELIRRARDATSARDAWDDDAPARGLTAWFHGPVAIDKRRVAGLVARELGVPLYQVELARLLSSWPGETERQLGDLLDAAEDSGLLLLFEDAEPLLAHPAGGYLRHRLKAFDGLAIVTTAIEPASDPAFRHPRAVRLAFPPPREA